MSTPTLEELIARNLEVIGQTMKVLRQHAGIEATVLARELDTTRSGIVMMEAGEAAPSYEELRKFSALLGIRTSTFFEVAAVKNSMLRVLVQAAEERERIGDDGAESVTV